MSDQDSRELEELRAEVAALKAARKQQAAAAAAEEAVEEAEEEAIEVAGDKSVHQQLDELMELLEQEIQDMPAITALAIFALGVLMGRFVR